MLVIIDLGIDLDMSFELLFGTSHVIKLYGSAYGCYHVLVRGSRIEHPNNSLSRWVGHTSGSNVVNTTKLRWQQPHAKVAQFALWYLAGVLLTSPGPKHTKGESSEHGMLYAFRVGLCLWTPYLQFLGSCLAQPGQGVCLVAGCREMVSGKIILIKNPLHLPAGAQAVCWPVCMCDFRGNELTDSVFHPPLQTDPVPLSCCHKPSLTLSSPPPSAVSAPDIIVLNSFFFVSSRLLFSTILVLW
jgi:hypothetical protein